MQINILYPDTWGPILWDSLQIVASGYPEDSPTQEEKLHYRNYFESFGLVIPCIDCQQHWKEVLLEKPLTDNDLTDRETLSRWVMDIHNIVNWRLDKRVTYSMDKLTKRFVSIRPPKEEEEIEVRRKPRKIKITNSSKFFSDRSLGKVQNLNHFHSTIKQSEIYYRSRQPQPNPNKSTNVKQKRKCGCANKK